MNDLYLAVSSPNEAAKIVYETRKVLATASFNLKKWNSNNQQVLDLLNSDIQLNPKTSRFLIYLEFQKQIHLL